MATWWPCSASTPGCSARQDGLAVAFLSGCLGRPRRRHRRPPGRPVRASRGRGAAGSGRDRRRRRVRGGGLRALRSPARRPRGRGARRARRRPRTRRIAVRRPARTGAHDVGRAVQGVHALRPGLARPRLAGSGACPAPRLLGQRHRRRRGPRPADGRSPPARSRARPQPSGRPGGSATARSTATPTSATGPTSTPPRACRPTSSGVASTRASCWPSSGRSRAHDTFRTELCWREFYADVLWHRPDTVHQALRPEMRHMERRHRARRRHRPSGPGPRAAPATRSSTPACASWRPKGGCTTGCA